MSSISRNSQLLVLFPNPRDKGIISTLARQIYPENANFFVDAFNQATAKPFGYLFVDLTPGCDGKLGLRSSIFDDEICTVYRPK